MRRNNSNFLENLLRLIHGSLAGRPSPRLLCNRNDVTVRLFTFAISTRQLNKRPPAKYLPLSTRSLAKATLAMPGRQEKLANKALAVVHQGDAPLHASKLPRPIQFPLVVILSLSSSALLYSFAADFTAGELAAVSRSLNEWWEVGALVSWRT